MVSIALGSKGCLMYGWETFTRPGPLSLARLVFRLLYGVKLDGPPIRYARLKGPFFLGFHAIHLSRHPSLSAAFYYHYKTRVAFRNSFKARRDCSLSRSRVYVILKASLAFLLLPHRFQIYFSSTLRAGGPENVPEKK